jgi:hypothetical protein
VQTSTEAPESGPRLKTSTPPAGYQSWETSPHHLVTSSDKFITQRRTIKRGKTKEETRKLNSPPHWRKEISVYDVTVWLTTEFSPPPVLSEFVRGGCSDSSITVTVLRKVRRRQASQSVVFNYRNIAITVCLLMMVVRPKHVVAVTTGEESKNCWGNGPLCWINMEICSLYHVYSELEDFWAVKRWQTNRHLWADCLDNLESLTSYGLHSMLQVHLYPCIRVTGRGGPLGWDGSHTIYTIGSQMAVRLSVLRTGRALQLRNITSLLLVLISVRGWVNPMAQYGRKALVNWKKFIYLMASWTRDLPACPNCSV